MTLAGAPVCPGKYGSRHEDAEGALEEKRQEKLADIQDQVDKGELTIRKMTPAERKANPPRERKPKR